MASNLTTFAIFWLALSGGAFMSKTTADRLFVSSDSKDGSNTYYSSKYTKGTYAGPSSAMPVIIAPYPHHQKSDRYFSVDDTYGTSGSHLSAVGRGHQSGAIGIGLDMAIKQAEEYDKKVQAMKLRKQKNAAIEDPIPLMMGRQQQAAGKDRQLDPMMVEDPYAADPLGLMMAMAPSSGDTALDGLPAMDMAPYDPAMIPTPGPDMMMEGLAQIPAPPMEGDPSVHHQRAGMDAMHAPPPAGMAMSVPVDVNGMPYMDLPCDAVMQALCSANPNCCKPPPLVAPVPWNAACVTTDLGAGECEFARATCHKCGFCANAPQAYDQPVVFEKQFAMRGSPVLLRISSKAHQHDHNNQRSG